MKSLIAVTLLSLVLNKAHCQLNEGNCKQFADVLPLKLRDLRVAFNEIKDYFQSRDDELDIMLLNEDLLQEFKEYLGCQSVAEMIQFYLEDVLLKASNASKSIKEHVNCIGNKLLHLRQTLKRCHRFLICEKKSKTIKNIKETYEKLQEKGIYKAMGEFDIFINYIEEYLILKTRK
ncbi:PREDICTED: interleukin-10 [Gekko japonicus]|uniref:Interleukin family protein n=1 Tax=Gekko japonicus TaxID=146911 RepID=A0ABM1LBC4_GEKJA|nr:PREDICTED: interleukin-10 [Gekko japonicus]